VRTVFFLGLTLDFATIPPLSVIRHTGAEPICDSCGLPHTRAYLTVIRAQVRTFDQQPRSEAAAVAPAAALANHLQASDVRIAVLARDRLSAGGECLSCPSNGIERGLLGEPSARSTE
jgi:hypothetical protein